MRDRFATPLPASGGVLSGCPAVPDPLLSPAACCPLCLPCRAEVARLAAHNAALEGRVRQLEGLVAAQGSALQRLAADLSAVQLQQQQQQQQTQHHQQHHNSHPLAASSTSSSFGGAPPLHGAGGLPPAALSRLAPHSGASARLPGSGGATGGTGGAGGSAHAGLLASGGAAGGGTGGSSYTSGTFASGPGGGGAGGNQLLAGAGSSSGLGPAEEGAGGSRVNGGGAGAPGGHAGFPVEDGFGEGSPWVSGRAHTLWRCLTGVTGLEMRVCSHVRGVCMCLALLQCAAYGASLGANRIRSATTVYAINRY